MREHSFHTLTSGKQKKNLVVHDLTLGKGSRFSVRILNVCSAPRVADTSIFSVKHKVKPSMLKAQEKCLITKNQGVCIILNKVFSARFLLSMGEGVTKITLSENLALIADH